MLHEIRLLHGIHAFPRALLVHHQSCAAYADLTAGRDERAIHVQHLRAASAAFEAAVAGVRAEAYLVELVDGALRATRINRDR
jgi:hypothetical protein